MEESQGIYEKFLILIELKMVEDTISAYKSLYFYIVRDHSWIIFMIGPKRHDLLMLGECAWSMSKFTEPWWHKIRMKIN